ncbi:MAG TPA: 6-bladed beta-propeller, partial [Phototrophicaceae bacterium]|nr:6-bladed beta-propeller [Phototrophicaceae bacterium]
AIMILISPLLMYYNRYIREDTPSLFYTLVMVWCTFMYINGPVGHRRKARYLFVFAGAMLGSMASKEVSFMYIAIFGSILTLYWVVRLGQHFFHVPGKTTFYFLTLAVLLSGVTALGMYVVLSINPLNTALTLGAGSQEYTSLIVWTALIFMALVVLILGTLFWVHRRGRLSRTIFIDVLLLVVLIIGVCTLLIYGEERSHVTAAPAVDASAPAAPAVPGTELDTVVTQTGFKPVVLYATYAGAALLIAFLVYTARAGWWRTLYRFRELDILWLMGTLVLPWLTPFLVLVSGATATDFTAIGQAVPEFIKTMLPVTTPDAIGKTYLAIQFIIPMLAISVTAGLVWNAKRWSIAAAVYYVLYLFFFTTVFTNMPGLAGMYTSLDYWLEQQSVRRGQQPQYYYLLIIMPFYEFLPMIGSLLAMIAGMAFFWRFRRERLVEREAEENPEALVTLPSEEYTDGVEEAVVAADVPDLGDLMAEKPKRKRGSFVSRPVLAGERLKEVPFLLFVSWWAIFMHIALTLAGEKMPWLGTHLTLPLIFLAGWFFGRVVERVDFSIFKRWSWVYLLLFPLLFVALAQVLAPLLIGPALGGLQQAQLEHTYQWIAGIVVAAIAIYALLRLVGRTGWAQFRLLLGVATFVALGVITLRSAWMASMINYDLATEFLVYAHGTPANKRVTEQLEEHSHRITDGMEIKFAYDFKLSWPGAWYFRNFKNAVFMGESPSPRVMEDAAVVMVGNENRAAVQAALEDRYYEYDYLRLWWPMQDYFGLTPHRIINTFDLSPSNTQAAQIRQGLFNIWWWRDYTTYGQALSKEFKITDWPVAERMYVLVRKDIAAQVCNLGLGEGTVSNPLAQQEVNLCTQNWQPLAASRVVSNQGGAQTILNSPRQVAVDAQGKVYVAEEFSHRITVINPDGTTALTIGQQGSQPGPYFERPNGVAVGPDGSIYVADTWNYRIQKFTQQGEYVTSWGQRGEYGAAAQAEPNDGLWGPRAVAVDGQGRVYVADTGNKRVRVYNSDGQYLYDIGSGGSGNGQLDEPAGLTISASGQLYVADTWNRRIAVFNLDGSPANIFANADGSFVNNFRVRGWSEDLGNRPYVAVDSARSQLYVTDPDAGRVLVYDVNGSCLGSFGQLNRETPGLSEFSSVGGIEVDAQGNVLVVDSGSGRVLQFAPFERPQPPIDSGQILPEVTGEVTAEVTPEVTGVVETFLDVVTMEVTPEATATAEVTPEATVTAEVTPAITSEATTGQ